ncbi:MAG: RNA methyltransferase [Burkholderiales bacterium]
MVPIDPLSNVRVVLCDTSHPGNIGAAARAMKTMGLTLLHLVRPLRFPDPEATWRAARAADVLEHARVHATLDEALTGVGFAVACSAREREVAVPALDCREAALRVLEAARTQPAALVFGNETSGLTTEDVNKCRLRGWIPANPEYSSLNLAAAVQVFAYELRMGACAPVAREPAAVLATHEEVEGFYRHLEQAMAESGFFDPEHPKKLMPRLRRLFARTGLEPEEVNILRGIVKTLARSREK